MILSSVWSSSVVLAFVVGSLAEMRTQVFCSTGLVAHGVAVLSSFATCKTWAFFGLRHWCCSSVSWGVEQH